MPTVGLLSAKPRLGPAGAAVEPVTRHEAVGGHRVGGERLRRFAQTPVRARAAAARSDGERLRLAVQSELARRLRPRTPPAGNSVRARAAAQTANASGWQFSPSSRGGAQAGGQA